MYSDIDVIVITEALPKNKIQEIELKLSNYVMVSNFEYLNCHRGIIIHARDYLNIESIQCYPQFKEFLLVSVKQGSDLLGHILAIYRSPNSDRDNNYAMLTLFNTVCNNTDLKQLMIIGDFNVKKIDWCTLSSITTGEGSYEHAFIECTLENFLCQQCNEPTRIRAGFESSLLDLIFVKDESMICGIEYEAPLGNSDHVLLCITVILLLQLTHCLIKLSLK